MNIDLPTLKNMLVEKLSQDPRVLAIYLHGSLVKGTHRLDSDVDCALLLYPGQQAFSAVELMHSAGELSAQVGTELDLGILSFSKLIYFVEAVSAGERIYCKDEALADTMVSRGFSYYAQLREDRKVVEEAYHAS